MKNHSTVKVEVVLNPTQIEQAVAQLPKTEQLRLLTLLERQMWAPHWDRIVQRTRRHARRYPRLSDDEVVRICREVRQDLHERTHRRRH